ncbi:MAG: hypothetical protein MK134_13195, partial [Dehalococcoidia bacterium]|nr:hypothetical protein [Dehalococcoidia bacterium]
PHSIASTYVAFELGARWGAEMRFMVILTPGVGAEVLVPPLDVFNAMRGDSRDQLLQMIHDLGEQLDITLSPAHTYGTQIDRVLALQDDSAGQSSISETLSWSSFLSQLNMLSSESRRLDCISKYKTHLPSSTVLDLPLVYVQWS